MLIFRYDLPLYQQLLHLVEFCSQVLLSVSEINQLISCPIGYKQLLAIPKHKSAQLQFGIQLAIIYTTRLLGQSQLHTKGSLQNDELSAKAAEFHWQLLYSYTIKLSRYPKCFYYCTYQTKEIRSCKRVVAIWTYGTKHEYFIQKIQYIHLEQ